MGSKELSAESGDEVRSWVKAAIDVTTARDQITAEATNLAAELLRRVVHGDGASQHFRQIIPLSADDVAAVQSFARRACLVPIEPDIQNEIVRLTTRVAEEQANLHKVTGFGRLLLFGGTRDKARLAEQFLANYHQRFQGTGLRESIERVAPADDSRIPTLTVTDLLTEWVGFKRRLPDRGANAAIEDSRQFAILPNATQAIRRAMDERATRRKAAINAGNAIRNMETDRLLADMAVDRLREATREKIRVNALIDNGITNVLAVLRNEHRLDALEGIGDLTAVRIRGAARTLRQNTFDDMPMRIDIKNRTKGHTEFLRRLRSWDAARRMSATAEEEAVIEELQPVANAIAKDTSHLLVVPSVGSTVERLREAIQTVGGVARRVADAEETAVSGDPWDDFLSRPADYFALLSELGFITEDEEKSHGELPAEIIDAIRDFELRGDNLVASLRGYQSFAARFALVQKKVIIGDEMGLGKTVEAIAVLAHLRSKGESNSIVICPAAVVTNWVREISAKSKLAAHRLHGPDREWAAKNWKRNGGVAVTTFETLSWLTKNVKVHDLSCVVVDEAHYIKNPDALRTQRTTKLINACPRAILLTGTPLENRLDEFRNLVGYLRSDLAVDANEFSPKKFRRQVAPAYLRRNQEDVLTELPELVEVDEWVTMSGADAAAYGAAVAQRNFMAMRQACMSQGLKSAKMARMVEIVDEAEANGRRVIVFSHFLDVLNDVAQRLPGRVFGPLTGSVAAAKRQVMVDEFSAAREGAVLVAQIVAGGVGLNIQAASIVVICEPQLKPTTEWQAIARAHRMGQLETVQVHRLLSDEGVDSRIREILARKKELFESFARESETAHSAPEAFDVTEAELARDIIAAERERLFGDGAPAATRGPTTASQQPTTSSNVDENSSAMASGGRRALPSGEPAAAGAAQDSNRIDSSRKPTDPSKRAQRVGISHIDGDTSRSTAKGPAMRAKLHASPKPAAESQLRLSGYDAFAERLPAISDTTEARVIEAVVRIVGVEGPVTGWRIHEVYQQCSPRKEPRDEFSRILNRAISAAERSKRMVSENPLGQTGNKPRTFKLLSQSTAVARALGPRTLDVVPVSEMVAYSRIVLASGAELSDAEFVSRIGVLLGIGASSDLRYRALTAKRILAQSGT